VLSLHTGYDTAYLTDAVGGSDYYTGAGGELPGYWQGAGAAALGLAGQVDAEVMRRLYHEDIGPDGQVLGRRQRPGNYPAASGSLHKRIEAEVAQRVAEAGGIITPEEVREIRLRLRAQWRNRVPFYDYTFSVPKSLSVLWASLLQAQAEAKAEHREADAELYAERAEQIRAAVRRANDRMIKLAEQRHAYTRTGHHSATTGEYRDAQGFIVASFPQHTNREGDPQLHVHNAIANRAQRTDGADEKWRALHGQPLFKEKIGVGAYGERFLEQEVNGFGWLRTVRRADGVSFEIGGISEEAADAYSYRSKETRARYRELEAEYARDHGHAPGKQARWALKQRAALETRDAKEHNPPAPERQLAAWARKAERNGAGKLAALHEAVTDWAAEHAPSELPGGAERARAIRMAVAEVQRHSAVWNRAQLVFELGRALPTLPADTDPEAYLDKLAEEALSGRAEDVTVLQVAPVPDVLDVTRLGLRKDGTSVYRPPGEAMFCTAEHRDHEQWMVDVAVLPVPQRVTVEGAAAAIDGTDLDHMQRQACAGLLTSQRLINCLLAPAGTGKTHVMAAFARAWEEHRAGRVIGITASTNAARVMADEAAKAGARMECYNIAQFLGKMKDSDETRGHVALYPGDVLVLDEATQVSTEDALRITQAARRCGAMVVATFDPEQLGSVDAGGIFRLIAARHGHYRLTEVRRFASAWEGEASLRLRQGDVSVLAEYDARGRVYHGAQDRVFDDAVTLYLNGYLQGQDSLLMATSNETAARLAALVRERLAELGKVGEAEITLPDGNQAGRGDLIRARLNTRIDADGQSLANRDVVRVESINDSGFGRLAAVRRQITPGQWSRPFFVPVAYLEENAELAYAGNVHVAQGRTVDRGHLVVDSSAVRSHVYVGATRGREKNTLHVVTGAPDPAQPTRAEREAHADAQIHRAAELRRAGRHDLADQVRLRMPDRPSDRQMAPWEAVLAQALQQDQPERTALEAMQAAQDFTTHGGHLFQLRQAFWWLDVAPQIDEQIRQRISPREYKRYLQDPERPALLQELRAHEIGGRAIGEVLDAITAAPFDGLRSIAAGLHGRLGKEPPPARGETKTWAERTPAHASPDIRAADLMADEHQAELGEQIARQAPLWATRAWGAPPAEPGALADDWRQRAGLVGYYREITGITDLAQAIGPPPSAQADLAELFGASVRALQLADDAAMLKAMNRGQLEAQVQDYLRAGTIAPPDVQAQVGDRQHLAEEARARAETAAVAGDVAAQQEAEAEAARHAADLASLAVADAARREWREATAAQETAARAAVAELRRRGIDERIPVTDLEVAEAAEVEREAPSVPRIDPAEAAIWRAEQTTRVEAGKHARREAAARATPVTEAEVAEYAPERQPEAGPEDAAEAARAAVFEEISAELDAIGGKIDLMAAQDAEREASRRAEMDRYMNEPVVHEPQAEPSLEASWQPGDVRGSYETEASEDAEPELEL
jgi:conjugative relaxase-like TrwC/TraI family protein